MLDDFIALSSVLTGEPRLERHLAEQYMNRISQDPTGSQLDNLLQVFRQIQADGGDIIEEVRQRIIKDNLLGPLAKQIIILWYTSALPDTKGEKWKFPDHPEQYFSGLVWPVIHAHVPGLSGGYFGHWRYPPEN